MLKGFVVVVYIYFGFILTLFSRVFLFSPPSLVVDDLLFQKKTQK